MNGQKTLHYFLAGTLLSASYWAFAQAVTAPVAPTTSSQVTPSEPRITASDLLQQPVYKNSWQKMVKGEKNLPTWARKGIGTSAPYEVITWEGLQYKVGSICKPHDCGNNFMLIAFSQDKKQVWGLRIMVQDKPQALDKPSEFATYQWLGRPSESIQAMLKVQLQQDPNWH
ncbi:MAG: hypothetical protein RL248_832 [Pseudomonadota bacterium]|jgi:Inhibitor of vertebrate lysozyme (Ivy)